MTRAIELHDPAAAIVSAVRITPLTPIPQPPSAMKRLLTLLLFCLPCLTPAAEPGTKPNIIFILADDLGLDGLSCYGSDLRKTPQIDKLAAFFVAKKK